MIVLKIFVEIMIYAAILYGAISLFRKICGNKMSPALRYGLWFLVVLRLAVPFTLESSWHLIELPAIEQEAKAQPVVEKREETIQSVIEEYAGEADAGTKDSMVSATATDEVWMPAGVKTDFEDIWEQQITAQMGAPESKAESAVETINLAAVGTGIKNFFKENYLWILAGVWMAGFLFCASRNILAGIRIKKGLQYSAEAENSRVREIYQRCRQELGIRKELPLYLIDGITTPALTVSLRPKLLFPADMADSLNERQIAYALNHELTHYKRRDHLVCLFLRGLSCVYWFYPLVRNLEQRILMDMEIACDSQVAASMDKENRKYYAVTLLEMFAQDREPNLMLGMVSGDTREEAERRIRGIFQRRKSHCSVRLAAIVLLFVMSLGCFTTACQPVVTEQTTAESVIPEDSDSSAEPESERETTEVQDAEMVCLISERKFTPDEMLGFLDVLLEGQPLYKTYEDSGIRSREEIQQAIKQCEWDIRGAKSDGDDVRFALYTAELEKLQEEYDRTPETVIYEEWDLEAMNLPILASEHHGQFWTKEGERRHVTFGKGRIDVEGYSGGERLSFGASFSEEEAIEKGLQLLAELGLDCEVLSVEVQFIETESQADIYQLPLGANAYYSLEFAQKLPEEVSAVYYDTASDYEEQIHISVMDGGIFRFYWDNPKKIEVIRKENIKETQTGEISDTEIKDSENRKAAYKLIEREFTQADVDAFRKAIGADGDIYMPFRESGVRSREEIQLEIDYYNDQLENFGELQEMDKENYVRHIEKLQKELEKAPETVEYVKVNERFDDFDPQKENWGDFWNKDGVKQFISCNSDTIQLVAAQGNTEPYYGAHFSESEAIQRAQVILNEMGLECELVAIEPVYVESYNWDAERAGLRLGSIMWYWMDFVPLYPENTMPIDYSAEEYTAQYKGRDEEHIRLTLTDKGLGTFLWTSPKEVIHIND